MVEVAEGECVGMWWGSYLATKQYAFDYIEKHCFISLSCLPSGLQSCFQAIWSFPLYKIFLTGVFLIPIFNFVCFRLNEKMSAALCSAASTHNPDLQVWNIFCRQKKSFSFKDYQKKVSTTVDIRLPDYVQSLSVRWMVKGPYLNGILLSDLNVPYSNSQTKHITCSSFK